ncbi:MAG: Uma2 family endonuclease [Chloroflexota bacterium]
MNTRHYTEAEYLAFEREAEFKHEYAQGEIIAMTGSTFRHNHITSNILVALDRQLSERCTVLAADMRVRVRRAKSYRYPDVVVVCGEPEVEDDNPGSLVNPAVLVEVASETTQQTDHTKKLREYLQLATLQAYVLVAQNERRVEVYQRQADGWQYVMLTGENDDVTLTGVGATLQISEVYRNVSFDDMPANDDEIG